MPVPTILQQATATYLNSDPSKTVTLASPVVAGHTLLLAVTVKNYGGSPTVTDSLGHTWQQVVREGNSGQGGASFYRVPTALAGALTVTYTPTQAQDVSLWLMEIDQYAPVLARWFNESSATTVAVGLAATTVADCLALGCLSNEGGSASLAAGSGWTTDASIDLTNATTTTLLGITKAIPVAGAADPTWTQTANPVIVVGLTLAPATAALANLTAATAAAFSTLPASATVDVGLADQFDNYRLWYKFTWTDPAYNLLTYSTEAGSGNQYQPIVTVYTGTPDNLTVYANQENASRQLTTPLSRDHLVYYLEVENFLGPSRLLNGEQCALSWAASNTAAAPAGAIFINDDSAGYVFPYVAMDPTDGTVYQSAPFPQGERVGILEDGRTLWHDLQQDTLWRYTAGMQPIAEQSWIGDGLAIGDVPLASDFDSLYYACDPGDVGTARDARVQVITAFGSAGATWTLPITGIAGIQVSRDSTVLYYSSSLATEPSAVSRWDLVNDVALTDLDAGETGYRAALDILVMVDGTVLVMRRPVGAGTSRVRHYDTDGTLLGTYTCTGVLNRITYALEDDEFWTWELSDSGFSGNFGTGTFVRVDLATMTAIDSFEQPQAVFGKTLQADPALVGPLQFHNVSCPFMITRTSLVELPPYGPTPEPPVPGPVWGTRTLVQRRLRRAPHLSDEQVWMFYRQLQIDLQAGIGLAHGQGEDPLLMLRYSDDGGHTWSDVITVSAGRQGKTKARAMFRRLGRSRDRVFEVSVSDPVPWFLVDAYLDVERGTN